MNHLGVKEYTIGSQRESPKYLEKANNIMRRVIFEILASKDKTGKIDYYDVIKIASKAGLQHSDLKKVAGGEDIPLKKQMFHKIAKDKIARKKRTSNSRAISEEDKKLVKEFYLSPAISRISPNKTIVVKRKSKHNPISIVDSIFYRQHTIKDIYDLFRKEYPECKIKRSKFFDLKPKNCKKPSSKQDVCPICKDASKNLPRLRGIHGQNLSLDDIKPQEAYKFHINIKNQRVKDFDRELDNLNSNQALVIMDFKANIYLGACAEEDSHIYFNAPQRSVFGLTIYLMKGEELYKVFFTVVSPILMHDSISVKRILDELVMPHPIFEHFGVKEISFWMDNAPNHFRTKETIASFHYLAGKYNQKIRFNYFAEYHGKSECDRHFGLMSRMYTEHASKESSGPVETTEQYISMYKTYILKYGGNVIPKRGASYDELHKESTTKLNVIVREWNSENVSEHMERQAAENKKKRTDLSIPYDKFSFKEKKDFTFTYFYSFKIDPIKHVLWAKLDASGRNSWKKFPYDIVSSYNTDYKVKLGILTENKNTYRAIARLNMRLQYHNDLS